MEINDILYSTENKIATITLNRPEKANAFSTEMLQGWVKYLEMARDDEDIRVIVVTGNGNTFCAGGDIDAFKKGGFLQGEQQFPEDISPALQRKNSLMKNIHRVALTLEDIDKPVICSLNGPAMGAGLDMALMCDIRIASDKAVFAESYVKIGLVPGDGGAYYLPRLVGVSKALEMLWLGETMDAAEALRIGLVNKVVPDKELKQLTREFALRLANGPALAIQMTKRAVYSGLKTDLRTALDMISSHMAIIAESADHKEGIKSFLEKRNPNFKGK
jgi:enoyl-CoA hydratase/carnithine racemase